MPSNWSDKALCGQSKTPEIWFSYKKEDIENACKICSVCPVQKECLVSAWNSDFFYGINGGLSEFEYLKLTWKEADGERKSNWSRANKLLQTVLRKIQ